MGGPAKESEAIDGRKQVERNKRERNLFVGKMVGRRGELEERGVRYYGGHLKADGQEESAIFFP